MNFGENENILNFNSSNKDQDVEQDDINDYEESSFHSKDGIIPIYKNSQKNKNFEWFGIFTAPKAIDCFSIKPTEQAYLSLNCVNSNHHNNNLSLNKTKKEFSRKKINFLNRPDTPAIMKSLEINISSSTIEVNK